MTMARERLPEASSPPPPRDPPTGPLDERQLVAAILQRDRKATARFVAEYTDAVYTYVRHRLAPRGDAVEDVVQEVFLAALGSLSQFAGTSGLRSWLLGIARHKVEDYYRRLLREPESIDVADEDPPVADPPIEEIIDRERLEARTRGVLRQLPESYGVALLWRYWENRSVREIADATGRTEK